MNHIARQLFLATITTVLPFFTAAAVADDDHSAHHRDSYAVSGLVSDIAGTAANLDPVLQNAWGIAFSPAGSPFWVNDNATGCSTLYDGAGVASALQVKIPLPSGAAA